MSYTTPSKTILIGDTPFTYKPETKKWLDLEILMLHVPLFISIFAFATGYLNVYIFLFLFYCIGMRLFIANHDRFHTNKNERLPRFLEIISENLWVVVTPWDEPYDSVKRKHLKHHATHGPGKNARYDLKNDPHCVYEDGGLVKVFLSSLFYEELQFILDIRYKRLTRSRLYRFLIYVPLQILFIYYFGLVTFLFVFLGWRIVGFSGWLLFSYGIHHAPVYSFGFSRNIPTIVKWFLALIHGRRISEGIIHHTVHHAWPTVPYYDLHRLDMIAYENMEHVPEMKPI